MIIMYDDPKVGLYMMYDTPDDDFTHCAGMEPVQRFPEFRKCLLKWEPEKG